MRNSARIQPIIDLLVKQGLFTNEQLEEWKQLPQRRLAQYLINKCIVIEDRDIYNFQDECWVTMEKLWFLWREFAIRWWYGKNWDEKLQYKIIRELDDEHIENIIKHMEKKNEWLNHLPVRFFSTSQIRKFKWEKMLRDIASLPDGTLIRLDWRWPCFTTKIPWEFRDYTSNDLFKPRNPDSYEVITKEEADKAIEEAMNSIHWS